ncbi:LLM class flavin-dependent oxidoreductase [Microtetraspora niveoalba]|uniref:LLM class flavin-dependent oxidoreductase n=1 Tax=Microtetraspora niveoalba TaxID=46175 RepID=UPI00083019EE|nr:LLM class flavin-dependent oxidoreductase [Microtetraspora niveoalba]
MRLGIFLIAPCLPDRSPGTVLAQTVDAVAAAEAAGFDDAWIAEHHFMTYGVCPSATVLAGVALGRTTRIAVGTAVATLSTRHPVALAEQAAVLHHASGGRFLLGVGRGGPWRDLEVFGTGLPRFERGFAEGLDLLCTALSRPEVAADGEFFRFRPVPMMPPARLRPLVACTSADTVRLTAERGLPMLLGMHIDDAEKAAMIEEYGRYAAAPSVPAASDGLDGLGVSGHVAAVMAHVADSTAAAVRELRAEMPRWLEPGLAGYVRVDGAGPVRTDPASYVERLCAIHPVGSPEHCVEVMRATAGATGLRHLILMVQGTARHERTLENIARLGAEVLPRLHGHSSTIPQGRGTRPGTG